MISGMPRYEPPATVNGQIAGPSSMLGGTSTTRSQPCLEFHVFTSSGGSPLRTNQKPTFWMCSSDKVTDDEATSDGHGFGVPSRMRLI